MGISMKRIIGGILVFCIFLTLCSCGQKAPTWQEQYDLGVRFLTDGNYEEAILAFTTAIEIDPMQTDTYASLAEAYVAMGDYDKALETLSQGYEVTESESLLTLAGNVRLDITNMDAAKSYLEVLEARQDEINAYYWQYGWYGEQKSTPVAFCDISGDGVPEMFFIWATDGTDSSGYEYEWDEFTLEIWTYADGAAKQCFSQRLGDEGHDSKFTLFQGDDSDNLYLDSWEVGEAANSESVEVYSFNAAIGEVEIPYSMDRAVRSYSPDGTTIETLVVSCQLNGADIESEEYDRRREEILQQKTNVVLQGGEDAQTGMGMTFYEAIEYLTNLALPRMDAAEVKTWELSYIEKLKGARDQIELDRTIAIADVCGDSTPELLYITTQRNTTETYYSNNTNTLHVVTFNGIVCYEAFSLELQFNDDDWPAHAFSIAGGNGKLVVYEMQADEAMMEDYSVYTFSGGTFSETESLSYATGYYGDGRSDYEKYFTYGGADISESEYSDYRSQLEGYGEILLIDSLEWRSDSPAYTQAKESNPGMSYEEAIRYLAGQIGEDAEALLYVDWNEAYRKFVFNHEYLDFNGPSDGGDSPYFDFYYLGDRSSWPAETVSQFLYDLNSDSTPELLVYDSGSTAGAAGYNIFGYREQKIVFLGFASGWPIGIVPDYQGLFFAYGGIAYGGYSYIEANDDGLLVFEELASKDDYNSRTNELITSRVTNDDGLYQALMSVQNNTDEVVQTYRTSEIREMGWDAFVNLYLG